MNRGKTILIAILFNGILLAVNPPPKAVEFIKGYTQHDQKWGENIIRNESNKPAHIYFYDAAGQKLGDFAGAKAIPPQKFALFWANNLRDFYVCDQAVADHPFNNLTNAPTENKAHCNVTTFGRPNGQGLNLNEQAACFRIKCNDVKDAFVECGLGEKAYSGCSHFVNDVFNRGTEDEKTVVAKDCGSWFCQGVSDKAAYSSGCEYSKKVRFNPAGTQKIINWGWGDNPPPHGMENTTGEEVMVYHSAGTGPLKAKSYTRFWGAPLPNIKICQQNRCVTTNFLLDPQWQPSGPFAKGFNCLTINSDLTVTPKKCPW